MLEILKLMRCERSCRIEEMDVSSDVVAGKRVLLIWHAGNSTEATQRVAEDLRCKAGESGAVLLEHAQRLLMGQLLYCHYSQTLLGGVAIEPSLDCLVFVSLCMKHL